MLLVQESYQIQTEATVTFFIFFVARNEYLIRCQSDNSPLF